MLPNMGAIQVANIVSLNATEEQIAAAKIEAEQHRVESAPFNPRTEVSADARFLWTRIFI